MVRWEDMNDCERMLWCMQFLELEKEFGTRGATLRLDQIFAARRKLNDGQKFQP